MSSFNLTINDSDNEEIEINRNSPFEFQLPKIKVLIL